MSRITFGTKSKPKNVYAAIMPNGNPYHTDALYLEALLHKVQVKATIKESQLLNEVPSIQIAWRRYVEQTNTTRKVIHDNADPWFFAIPMDQFVLGASVLGELKDDNVSGLKCKSKLYRDYLDVFFAVYHRCWQYDQRRTRKEDKLHPVLVLTMIPKAQDEEFKLNRQIDEHAYPSWAGILFRLSIQPRQAHVIDHTPEGVSDKPESPTWIDFTYMLKCLQRDCFLRRKYCHERVHNPYNKRPLRSMLRKKHKKKRRRRRRLQDDEALESTEQEIAQEEAEADAEMEDDDDDEDEDEAEDDLSIHERELLAKLVNSTTIEMEIPKFSSYTQYHTLPDRSRLLQHFTMAAWNELICDLQGYKETDIPFVDAPEKIFNIGNVLYRLARGPLSTPEIYNTRVLPEWMDPNSYVLSVVNPRWNQEKDPQFYELHQGLVSSDDEQYKPMEQVYCFPGQGIYSWWLYPRYLGADDWRSTHFPYLREHDNDTLQRTMQSFHTISREDGWYAQQMEELSDNGFLDDSQFLATKKEIDTRVVHRIDRETGQYNRKLIDDWIHNTQRRHSEAEASLVEKYTSQFTNAPEKADERYWRPFLSELNRRLRIVDMLSIQEFSRELFHPDGGIYPTLRAISLWMNAFLKERERKKEVANFCFVRKRSQYNLSFFGNTCIHMMTEFDVLHKTYKHHINIFRCLISFLHIHLPPPPGRQDDQLKPNWLISGAPSDGKSFVVLVCQETLIPNTWKDLQGMSKQAMTPSGLTDEEQADPLLTESYHHVILFADDPQGNMIRKNADGSVSDQTNYIKNVSTSGKHSRVTQAKDENGRNVRVDIHVKAVSQFLICTNDPPHSIPDALIARFSIIECRELVYHTKSETYTQEPPTEEEERRKKICIDLYRSIQALAALAGVYMRAERLPRIDMSCFLVMWSEFVRFGIPMGLTNLDNKRTLKMVYMVAECFVLMSAICTLLCQINSPLQGRKWQESHILLLRPYLVCTVEHVTMSIGLYASKFEDKTVSFTKYYLIQWMHRIHVSSHPTPQLSADVDTLPPAPPPLNENQIALQQLRSQITRRRQTTIPELTNIPDIMRQTSASSSSSSSSTSSPGGGTRQNIRVVNSVKEYDERGKRRCELLVCHNPFFLENRDNQKGQIEALAGHLWSEVSSEANKLSITYGQFVHALHELTKELIQVPCEIYVDDGKTTEIGYSAHRHYQRSMDITMERHVLVIERGKIQVPCIEFDYKVDEHSSKTKKCMEKVLQHQHSQYNDYLWGEPMPDQPGLFEVISTNPPDPKSEMDSVRQIIIKDIHVYAEETTHILQSTADSNTSVGFKKMEGNTYVSVDSSLSSSSNEHSQNILNMDFDEYFVHKHNHNADNRIGVHELQMMPSNERAQSLKELWLVEKQFEVLHRAPYPLSMPGFVPLLSRAREKQQQFLLYNEHISQNLEDQQRQGNAIKDLDERERKTNVAYVMKRYKRMHALNAASSSSSSEPALSLASLVVNEGLYPVIQQRLHKKADAILHTIEKLMTLDATEYEQHGLQLNMLDLADMDKSTEQVLPSYLHQPCFEANENELYRQQMLTLKYYTVNRDTGDVIDHRKPTHIRMVSSNGFFHKDNSVTQKIERLFMEHLTKPRTYTSTIVQHKLQELHQQHNTHNASDAQEEKKEVEEEEEEEEDELMDYEEDPDL